MTKHFNPRDHIITNDGRVFSLMYTESEIKLAIKDVAYSISKAYEGKVPIFVCVLNGAFMFFSDLLKRFDGACETDFIKLSSYKDDVVSSGLVTMSKNFDCNIAGRDIIIVEDIVDSGLSLNYIKELLNNRPDYEKPSSVKTVALFSKPLPKNDGPDYFGIITSSFIIGYGLDYKQQYRDLPHVYALMESK